MAGVSCRGVRRRCGASIPSFPHSRSPRPPVGGPSGPVGGVEAPTGIAAHIGITALPVAASTAPAFASARRCGVLRATGGRGGSPDRGRSGLRSCETSRRGPRRSFRQRPKPRALDGAVGHESQPLRRKDTVSGGGAGAGVLAFTPLAAAGRWRQVFRAGWKSPPAVGAHARARERLRPRRRVSRSGPMPEPTVTVRMKEDSRLPRRARRGRRASLERFLRSFRGTVSMSRSTATPLPRTATGRGGR